jgi:hypothetical protein
VFYNQENSDKIFKMGRRKKQKFLLNILILAAVFIAIFALLYFYRSTGTQKINKDNGQPAPVGINIKDAPALKKENEKWVINIVYPTTGENYIDTQVNSFIQKQLSDFEKMFADYGAPVNPNYKNSLDIVYSSQIYNNRILTFKFDIRYYTGGAHDNYAAETLCFDLASEKQLVLSDLFKVDSNYLQKISNITIGILNKSGVSDSQWINEGAGPVADNYKVFTISNDSINFFFQPYQVASFAAGEQSVTIPLSQIQDILDPSLFVLPNANQETGLTLDGLKSNNKISSPLNIIGSVTGNGWTAADGQAGRVELLDSNGNLMAASSLSAITNWNQLPVKFDATLTFLVPQGITNGRLVFYNKNTSNKAENDKIFILPVSF